MSSITIFKNMWGIDIGSRKDRFHVKDATKYICKIFIYYIIYILYMYKVAHEIVEWPGFYPSLFTLWPMDYKLWNFFLLDESCENKSFSLGLWYYAEISN